MLKYWFQLFQGIFFFFTFSKCWSNSCGLINISQSNTPVQVETECHALTRMKEGQRATVNIMTEVTKSLKKVMNEKEMKA